MLFSKFVLTLEDITLYLAYQRARALL